MSRQQYRSKIGIMDDILSVTMDAGSQGIIVSSISRRANLSYDAVLKKCQTLVDAGLLSSKKGSKKHLIVITEKGMGFFREFQRFKEVLQSLNLWH